MDTSDFPNNASPRAENADGLVYAVQLRLEESHGWGSRHAEEYCFDFRSNYQRIAHMCTVLGFSADKVADEIDREAVAAGQAIR